MNTNTTAIMMGTFLVFPLDPGSFENFSGKSKMDSVTTGKSTVLHTHPFLSAYVTDNLNLSDGQNNYVLPQQALVMVPIDQPHSWIASKSTGKVGSVGHDHPVQELA